MTHRVAAVLLLLVLAGAPGEAARKLKQYSNIYQPHAYAYGNAYGYSHHGGLIASKLEAKADLAKYAVDSAKSFVHGVKQAHGKGATVVQAVAPTYVVTSQPQIMVAPLPQLIPTMVASQPQVQPPPPSPPQIQYVPVPVKETVVKPLIVPIPKIKPVLVPIKPPHPKEFLADFAKGFLTEMLADEDTTETPDSPPVLADFAKGFLTEMLADEDTTETPDSPPAATTPTVAAAAVTVPAAPVEVPVPSAPAADLFAPPVVAEAPAPVVAEAPAPVVAAAPAPVVAAAPAVVPAPAPAAANPSMPAANPSMPPATAPQTTVAAAAAQTAVVQPVAAGAPAEQPVTPAMITAPLPTLSTFQPVQVLQVQNQVNTQGQIVGQAYGVAAAGK